MPPPGVTLYRRRNYGSGLATELEHIEHLGLSNRILLFDNSSQLYRLDDNHRWPLERVGDAVAFAAAMHVGGPSEAHVRLLACASGKAYRQGLRLSKSGSPNRLSGLHEVVGRATMRASSPKPGDAESGQPESASADGPLRPPESRLWRLLRSSRQVAFDPAPPSQSGGMFGSQIGVLWE